MLWRRQGQTLLRSWPSNVSPHTALRAPNGYWDTRFPRSWPSNVSPHTALRAPNGYWDTRFPRKKHFTGWNPMEGKVDGKSTPRHHSGRNFRLVQRRELGRTYPKTNTLETGRKRQSAPGARSLRERPKANGRRRGRDSQHFTRIRGGYGAGTTRGVARNKVTTRHLGQPRLGPPTK